MHTAAQRRDALNTCTLPHGVLFANGGTGRPDRITYSMKRDVSAAAADALRVEARTLRARGPSELADALCEAAGRLDREGCPRALATSAALTLACFDYRGGYGAEPDLQTAIGCVRTHCRDESGRMPALDDPTLLHAAEVYVAETRRLLLLRPSEGAPRHERHSRERRFGDLSGWF